MASFARVPAGGGGGAAGAAPTAATKAAPAGANKGAEVVRPASKSIICGLGGSRAREFTTVLVMPADFSYVEEEYIEQAAPAPMLTAGPSANRGRATGNARPRGGQAVGRGGASGGATRGGAPRGGSPRGGATRGGRPSPRQNSSRGAHQSPRSPKHVMSEEEQIQRAIKLSMQEQQRSPHR